MATNKEIIETAKSYLGKLTYVFGSDDISGGSGDCSSFTEYVFAVHGFDIGADTSAQYSQGIPVARENITAGDLVFFKDTYNSGKVDGVSHVGIATSNNTFIHLSSSGCLNSSLEESYWKEHYLDARRVHGLSYEEGVLFEYIVNASNSSSDESELKWWGDIVRVVIIALVILAIILFVILGIGKDVANDTVTALVTKKGGAS